MTRYIQLNQDVEKFIYKGANLMAPGIQKIDGDFKIDDVYALKSSTGK